MVCSGFKPSPAPLNYLKEKQVIRVKKTHGANAPCTQITWASLGSEEPSLKLLRLSDLQRTNSS